MTPIQTFAASIRILSMDAVQKANSGHPGAPMGMADMAAVLWHEHLRVNPADTRWYNRDRFILSNGHASMLQYALLHLTGFDISLEDIKKFRQLHSKTPGHPEYRDTPGVEITTGPLGQGIATAVGMAIAERHLAARYNRDNLPLVDHHTYVFLGDGCLMEGVSAEACSLAGTLGLGKLICLYDSNGISIDGEIAPWFGEDVAARYEAYGWHVIRDIDGHNTDAINTAINAAKAETGKPSLIICRTKIGYGSPNLEGTEKTHGAPLGKEEIALTKKALGLPEGDFELPEGAYQAASLREKGAKLQDAWEHIWQQYQDQYPAEAQEFARVMSGKLPENLDRVIDNTLAQYNEAGGNIATRKASENAINLLLPHLPELIGGSADLTGSNLTWSKAASKSIKPGDFSGNYLHYGVREFAMSTIMNGIALHGGLRAYGGTFLVFSDYMRNGIRLSALMKLPVTYVLTHDSIGLGEDGPTHQPVEHIASLRLIPNLNVWRPCDQQETLVAWRSALNPTTPTALALSRQGLPEQKRDEATRKNIVRGGYILEAAEHPSLVLVATGSEVALIVAAAARLREEGQRVQVVSMPCLDLYQQQDAAYRATVLPKGVPTVVVEAGVTLPWRGISGDRGTVIGIDTFGASAPADELFPLYGLTVENIVAQSKALL
ncbi:transketolase [Cardiobacterium valvarum]|uniref:Transketolase n=1 Tax=Cardiobacterium valvarum TaxID=194702 RepID=A0A381EB96_9GAMM|nr:transketolase [Cardiobacterium valvarum]SUX24291.1 Transketolase 1 [Cardiobacterium valvarum]